MGSSSTNKRGNNNNIFNSFTFFFSLINLKYMGKKIMLKNMRSTSENVSCPENDVQIVSNQ